MTSGPLTMSKFTNDREACEKYVKDLNILFAIAWNRFGKPNSEDDWPRIAKGWVEEDGVFGWQWVLNEDRKSCLYTIGTPGLDPGFDIHCSEAGRQFKAGINADVEIAAAAVATVLNPKATWEHDTEFIYDYLWEWIASASYRQQAGVA